MNKRTYYSARTGKNSDAIVIELPMLLRLCYGIFSSFTEKDYFQAAFGYYCVDQGDVPGRLGADIGVQVFLLLRKEGLWPIPEQFEGYSEDDLFDMIEFLFDCASKPMDGYNHTYSDCGWHYSEFDQAVGQAEFREEINRILEDYRNPCVLSEDGEIQDLPYPGLDILLSMPLLSYDPPNVEAKVDAAKRKFQRTRSSSEDRRDAIRELADVLEFLRPKIKLVLSTNDENDIYNIINNFGIRHHNLQQRTAYDQPVFYLWMFHFFLATIHAAVRLIKERESVESNL
jgi:hypothetical protein